ncbi:hypothetical protein BS78_05G277000 [Paspalum vaginatum]|nr:hypothetical protein BS78_05G277000 [Paspalum vaginatum]
MWPWSPFQPPPIQPKKLPPPRSAAWRQPPSSAPKAVHHGSLIAVFGAHGGCGERASSSGRRDVARVVQEARQHGGHHCSHLPHRDAAREAPAAIAAGAFVMADRKHGEGGERSLHCAAVPSSGSGTPPSNGAWCRSRSLCWLPRAALLTGTPPCGVGRLLQCQPLPPPSPVK